MSSNAIGHTLFDTAVGRCAVIWSERALLGTALPAETEAETVRWIARRYPAAIAAEPPSHAREAIDGIRRLLQGEPVALNGLPLDWQDEPVFDRRVWELALTIPPGSTKTYGDLALALGHPALARSVGQALGRNPFPIVVPCHRVLASGGRPGGFSAPGAVHTKLRLLAIERARPYSEPDLFSAD